MTALPSLEVSDLSAVVATRVRGLMAELRLNQDDLAAVLSVSRSAVSDRLRGVKAFPLNEVPVLAARLGVTLEYLLGLSDERSPRRSAPGGGSFFVLPEAGSDLRACRDSNPKPSDLSTATGRARRAWGMLVEREIGDDEPNLSASIIRFPIERRRAS